ncbi:hypothetical protein GCM10011521_11170 [Arenimonas soli]|uniref:DUF3261 domain-containing protein n=1 Tax=Arenimonas soli TaxID=2269504 RepID=A0ABQ1HGS8_9GAMM|nr:DUF3261 domain-containing protein [Arenimonas soli]GGA74728.1 hypothetical protein GCM10011521_11170 [Arenimonas soli]
MRGLIVLLLAAVMAGCAPQATRAPASAMPALALSPAALGGTLALEQRLVFEHGERRDTVDALVEADAHVVRIVLHRQGQVLLRLAWDGKALQQDRAEQLPDALSAQRVLADLQLVYWPADAINQALPAGWQLHEGQGVRTLVHQGDVVATVHPTGDSAARLENLREGYRLHIRSVPVHP